MFPAFGSFLFALSVGLMLLFTSHRNYGLEIGILLLAGIGIGMNIQMPILTLQNVVGSKDLAAGIALGVFFHVVCFCFFFVHCIMHF